MKEKIKGLLLCLAIAVPAWLLGRKFAVVGGPVISILLGMIVGMFLKNRAPFDAGIKFTSKKILQWAVILLGFGIVQIGLALKSHDAGQRAQGFMTFFGGVVIYFAKDILDMIL